MVRFKSVASDYVGIHKQFFSISAREKSLRLSILTGEHRRVCAAIPGQTVRDYSLTIKIFGKACAREGPGRS